MNAPLPKPSMLAAALRAARIAPVFPLAVMTKNKPLLAGWPALATRDERLISAQWGPSGTPDANVAVHCAGLVVVDIDKSKGGLESFKQMDDMLGFPDTYTVRTPSGGFHAYYKLPQGHPGVPNTVEALGKGLDVRSTGGYVLAAGSRTAAGEYVVEDDLPIADAPQWMLDKLGQIQPKALAADVPDAPVEALERAREWLAKQEPAIEGQGGDAHTYATACKLRDLGVSEAQALELTSGDWNERCAPPWAPAELEAKIANAYTFAQNEQGGARGVVEDDLPLPRTAAANDSAPARRLRRPRALEALNPGPELWAGILPERAVFAIGALPGRSKSYTATGLAYALATDAGQYLGRAIPTGTAAVYVDVERLSTTELRLAVWCHADARDPAKLALLLTDGVRLSDPSTVKALIDDLHAVRAELGRRISVVLLDSLGAMLPGQEMNSSGPATMAGTQLRRIRDSLDCAVGVVAHSPKSEAETVAGSLHFDAIFDTALFVRSDDGAAGSLYVKKDNGLALEEHERFTHWRRDTLSALVGDRTVRVHRLEHGEAPAAGARVRHPWKESSTTGRVFKKHIQLSPDNRPLSAQDWKDGCLEFLSPRQVRSGFFDAKDMLRKHRAIEETAPGSDLWVRRMHGGDLAETTARGAS